MVDTINWTREVDIDLTGQGKNTFTIPFYDTTTKQYLIQVTQKVNQDKSFWVAQTLTLPGCKNVLKLEYTSKIVLDNNLGIIYNEFDGPTQKDFAEFTLIRIFSKPFQIIEPEKSETYALNSLEQVDSTVALRFDEFKNKWFAAQRKAQEAKQEAIDTQVERAKRSL